jgi:hypothetical protein
MRILLAKALLLFAPAAFCVGSFWLFAPGPAGPRLGPGSSVLDLLNELSKTLIEAILTAIFN